MLMKAACQKDGRPSAILDADVQIAAAPGTRRGCRLLAALLCAAACNLAGGLEVGGDALCRHLGLLLFGAQARNGKRGGSGGASYSHGDSLMVDW